MSINELELWTQYKTISVPTLIHGSERHVQAVEEEFFVAVKRYAEIKAE